MKNKKVIIGSVVILPGLLLCVLYFTPFLEVINGHADSSHETDLGNHDKSGKHDDNREHEEPRTHDGQAGNDAHKGHDDHEEEKEQFIKMSESQMKEFGIELSTASSGKLHTFANLPGEIVLNPDRLAHIAPRIPGVVRKVLKTTGDNVSTGEIIAILESKEMGEAKIEYFSNKAQIEVVKVERDVAVTQIEVAKTDMDIRVAKQKIAAANLEWQKVIHGNTELLLNLLKEEKPMDTISRKLSGKPIGENRTKLLTAYAALNYAEAAYDRESGLRKKKISSESDYLDARKEYGSTESEFQAVYEEVVFENRLALMEKEQSFEMAKQAVKSAKQVIKVAEQDRKAKEVSLNVAFSNLMSALRKLKIYGLTEKEINKLKGGDKVSEYIARYVIRAPFNGTVIEKHITLGEMVREDSETFVIADLSTVWANLNVYQKDLPFVQKEQTVIITSAHGIPDVEGKISWVSPLVGEETRTAVARVVLPNKNGRLLPGLFVNGKVAIGENTTVSLVIPKNAIQTVEGKTVVFVRTGEGFELRSVTIGRDNGTELEITSGLNLGQEYVKTGVFTLKAELAKGSFGDGHNH